jgi:hypothetical protein
LLLLWHRTHEWLLLRSRSDHSLLRLWDRARERLLLRSRSDDPLLRLWHCARERLWFRSRSDHPQLRLSHLARARLLRRCQVTSAIRFARLNCGDVGPNKAVPGAVVSICYTVAVLG